MCQLLQVSPASYYRHKEGHTRKITQKIDALKDTILEVFHHCGDTLGYRRIYDRLKKNLADQPELLTVLTSKVVWLIMHRLGLVAKHQRRKHHKAQYRSPQYRSDMIDHINRDFTAHAPGMKLVGGGTSRLRGNITFIPTKEGMVKLATVIDLYNREIIGYTFSTQVDTALIIHAIGTAIEKNTIRTGAIFHSDRGSNYTSHEFRSYLQKHDIIPSIGGTGSCFDNAIAKSIFSTLKQKETYDQNYDTIQEAIFNTTCYTEF